MRRTPISAGLPWAIAGLQAGLTYFLLRRHGQTLLDRENLRGQLAAANQLVGSLIDDLVAARQGGTNAPHTGHDHGSSLPSGLPLGSPAPAFVLPDLDGRDRTLQDFLDRPLLLAFFDPQCGFCLQMAPRLGEVPETGPRVLLVSRGDPAEHRRLAAEHRWHCDVVLQQGSDVSTAYKAAGTPTGYLIDAQGRIASDLAIGADALLRLVPTVGGSNGRADLTADAVREKAKLAADRARAAGLAVTNSHLNRNGLPVGTRAPDFHLPDLDGVERSLSELRGKRVLLVFSDPDCGPCQVLAPELARLARHRRDDHPQVVMISRGDHVANRAKADEHGWTFPVLLQRQWEVSRQYAMFATPVGYLIDEAGIVAAEVAVGVDAILALATVGMAPAVGG